ncbi:hypothetical protein CYG68_19935 [Morganella morganii]|uniref:Uncharacterized protein n=1 Tax=Morganella morganii TaxID=582 RepID=A0A8I0U8R3_MORMO|nr:hypothetical protein [Morganella morganii]
MDIALFLRDTLVWVWILLAFLLRRGFAALYDRKMTTGRFFFLVSSLQRSSVCFMCHIMALVRLSDSCR